MRSTTEPPRLQVLCVLLLLLQKPYHSSGSQNPDNSVFARIYHVKFSSILCRPINIFFCLTQILFEATVKGISPRVLGSASYQVGKLDVLNVSAGPFRWTHLCMSAGLIPQRASWKMVNLCVFSLPRELPPCSSFSCSWTTACSQPTWRTRGLLNFQVWSVYSPESESGFNDCLEQSAKASCDPAAHRQYVSLAAECF